jgi:replicative DNA helicase
MIQNFEMQLTATLLIDPKQIQFLDINPDWIEGDSFKQVISAIQSKNGEEELLSDIQKTIKQLYPLSSLTADDLIVLKTSEPTASQVSFYANQVHKDYLKRELKRLTSEYSLSEDDRFLTQITMYQEELESLKKVKSDGSIAKGYADFVEHLEAKQNPFIRTFPKLDTSLGGGFGPGELAVIGARPAVGKTAFAINLAMSALEMTTEQMMYRFVSKKAKINNMQIRNPIKLPNEKKRQAALAYKELSKLNIRIYDQEYTQLNDIVLAIRKRAKKGKYLAIIDYAGLVAVKDSRKNAREILNEVTRRLKLLTNELGITVILLSQLSRDTEKTGKVPTLADLKESGSLEQDANIVMFLYREKPDDRKHVQVKIAKSRDGVIGEIPFKFIGQFMEFSTEDY